jgi:hypothetical protein
MKTLLKTVSFAGLAIMFLASGMLFAGKFGRSAYLVLDMVGTAAWFGTVPFWMKRRLHQSEG